MRGASGEDTARAAATTGGAQALLATVRKECSTAFVYAGFLSIFLSLLQLIVPLYMLQIYDRVLNSRSVDTLVMLTLVALGGLVAYGVLEYLRGHATLVAGERLVRRLNLPVLQAAVTESLNGQGGQSPQAIRDLNDLRLFLTSTAINVPFEAACVPVFLIVLFALHPIYGLVALVAAAVIIGLSLLAELLARRPLAEAGEGAARSFGEIGTLLRNGEVIEAMGMLPAFSRRWNERQTRSLAALYRGNHRAKSVAAASKAIRLALQIAMLATGVTLVIENQVTSGSMVAATIMMGRVLHPFEQLIEGWRHWVFAAGAWRRVRDLLQRRVGLRQSFALPEPAGRLQVDRLTFMPPGAEKPILRGVSFALEPGEMLGVVGPSGSGKSTLARLLVGVFEPTAGGVYLDGQSVFLWERENFGQFVGYLPQTVSLLDGTVRENIARLDEVDPFAVVEAAKKADVHELIGRLPFGYDTAIGGSGFLLSGGQRQRIALARALFGNPKFVVLDEPNANLDHAGERALLDALAAAKANGVTVVLIAHRPSVMGLVDKMLVLKDGVVDQFGTRPEIMKALGGTPTLAGGEPRRPVAAREGAL